MNRHKPTRTGIVPNRQNIFVEEFTIKIKAMKQQTKKCVYCEGDFIPERRNGKYCSPTCRQYGYLKRKTGEAPHDRVKEKETVNQELSVVPALVLEEATEQVAPVVVPKENKVTKSPDKKRSKSTEPVLKVVTKTYEDLINEEEKSLNENLTDWWYTNIGNIEEEKQKLVNENAKAKKLIDIILRLDGMWVYRTHLARFLVLFEAFEEETSNGNASSFYQSIWMIGDIGAMAKEFLKTIPEHLKVPSRMFKLTMEQRAEFEVMLKFMNRFTIRTPDFWLLGFG